MKKYFLILGCLLWSGVVAAQTYQRANKGPNFFMPAGAMDSNAAQKARQQAAQQQALQQQRQNQINSQKQAQARANAANKNSAGVKPQQPQAVQTKAPVTAKQPVNQMAQKKPEVKNTASQKPVNNMPQKTITANKPLQIKQKNIGALMAKPQPVVVEKKVAKEEVVQKSRSLFEQIMDDYQQDLKLIGQKQKVRNYRLQRVLAAFKDADIEF